MRIVVFFLTLTLCYGQEVTTESKPPQASQYIQPTHKVEHPNYNINPNTENNEAKSQPQPQPILAPLPVPAQPASPTGAASNAPSSPTHRQGRFFFPFNGFTNSLTGNPSLSSVLTLNLNNLALVGLFLIGVFILLPSIIGFLTGLTGAPYAAKSLRSDEQQPTYMWGIMQMLDNVLSKNNIDVRVCMERATCHVSKNTLSSTSRGGSPSALESALNFAITSSYGQNILSSYRLKDAVDRGRNGQDCDSYYNRCPYSVGNLSKLISTYYTGFGGGAPSPSPFSMYNATGSF